MSKFTIARKFGMAAALAATIGSGLSMGQNSTGQDAGDLLERGFQNPPDTAKPRVWWHWMNGNITKEGIDRDLDWMNRVGIGGFQNFDAALNTPKVVDKRLIYMTPEWKDAFLFATQKADKLGLEMAIAGSPGWSESGGPWVEPSHAMKKFVWTETAVQGGQPFHGVLRAPSAATGPFQNRAQADPMGQMAGVALPTAKDFYADSVVVAYRRPAAEIPMQQLNPKITLSGGSLDVAHLSDHDLMSTARVPIAPLGQKSWIQFEFSQAQPIQAVTFAPGGPVSPLAIFAGETGNGPVLEASDDGQTFRPIVTIPTAGAAEHTLSFAPVSSRFFRLSFLTKAAHSGGLGDIDFSELGVAIPAKPTDYEIAELELHTGARINRFEEKAGFAALPDLYTYATPAVPAKFAITSSEVVDLTAKMAPDGRLNWTPPPGQWTVLRMGYSLTGITNHPATPEATGPEVDKLNRGYVKEYIEHYLDNYKGAVGELMGKRGGLKYVITDSWESGTQNWTDEMIAEFTRRRGYDPKPWMPVLTGHVIDSAESSDRFLWDFRKTIADLLAENHYGQIAESVHARGMGVYGESHESGRATIADGMEMKRYTDVPMAAMWTQRPGVNEDLPIPNADIRESASIAHIYGQNLVAAESMTAAASPWAWSPETLKPTADKELSMGLNRFVIHTSVHQPLDKAPGLALGPFGQWFNRNETWAEQAQPWITYLARNSYLLQQGRFVADIVYFYGEDSNLTAIFAAKGPGVPAGYNFDYVNADALIHKLTFSSGQLTASSGMTYKVLALDPYSRHMSLPVLRKIQALVRDGATVIGDRPTDTPSLDDKGGEFQRVVSELWGSDSGVHTYGKGKVYGGQSLADVLQSLHIAKDFEYSKPKSDTKLLFVHRAVTGGDLYYVDNRTTDVATVDATFRVTGRSPELWHADTGKIETASYRIQEGGTAVPLTLQPYETVFVVFRKPTSESSHTVPAVVLTPSGTIDGTWDVSFQAGRGAPDQVKFETLRSWSDSEDAGVKYFSGHGTYTRTIEAPAAWFKPEAELWLDLGDVKNLAEVKVNGTPLGILWKAPFRTNVTKVLKPGANQLEITVTNLWVNRLIGDQQPGVSQKFTFTTHNPYKANSPLLPSGLIGPVQVVRSELRQ